MNATFKLNKKIFSKLSKFQLIEVYETYKYGNALLLDGVEQFTDFDEKNYHESMTKIPFANHKDPNDILIIGGGDGGIVRECLKFKSVKNIDLCEIDKDVIDCCLNFFPRISNSLKNEKVNIINEDGSIFINSLNKKYDLVFVDSTDPISFGANLYSRNFYKNLNKILNEDGICVLQMDGASKTKQIMDEIFPFLSDNFELNFYQTKYDREDRQDVFQLFCILSKKALTHKTKEFILDGQYKLINKFLKLKNWIYE